MKKKILFMIINMNVGGTEKALLNMLQEIDNQQYDVTVMMLEEYGGFLKDIPAWIHIKYFENYQYIKGILNNPPQITIKKFINQGMFIKGFYIGYLHLLSKITKDRTAFFKYILKDYRELDEEYDLAVAYAGPMDFISYYVINNIKSKNKVQWIHFDVTKIGFNKIFASKIYSKFDKVFIVSNEAKNKFDNLVPTLKNKTQVFLNIISQKTLHKMANEGEGFKDDFKGIRILTVGRLTYIKGQYMTIPVLKRLRDEGYNVRWYCIGEGIGREKCEALIKEHNLEDDYILLGSNTNPYPFMRDCDIYVQSSKHEGYCITLAEARCFNKPIVTTNFTGANEQIIHKKNGLIAEISEDDLYEKVKELLDNNTLANNIKSNLNSNGIDITDEIEKLYRCIE